MYVEVRIKETLKQDWSDWFETLIISNPLDGETVLSGELPDQSALLGLLNRIHGLNLELLSFSQSDNFPPAQSKSEKEPRALLIGETDDSSSLISKASQIAARCKRCSICARFSGV